MDYCYRCFCADNVHWALLNNGDDIYQKDRGVDFVNRKQSTDLLFVIIFGIIGIDVKYLTKLP